MEDLLLTKNWLPIVLKAVIIKLLECVINEQIMDPYQQYFSSCGLRLNQDKYAVMVIGFEAKSTEIGIQSKK